MLVTSALPQWFVRMRPSSAPRIRLFCVPYAGGTASVFRQWGDALANVDVCAVQFPGHGSRFRESCLDRVPDLAAGLVRAMQPELDMPFALFGHSMGALIAFEVARELRRRRYALPDHLFVSACCGPQNIRQQTPISLLPDPEFVHQLSSLYNGIPPQVMSSPGLLALMLPALRADMRALESYAYSEEPPLDFPMSCFAGKEDPHSNPENMSSWRQQTRAGFSFRLFSGGHFFLESNRSDLLRAIADDLRSWRIPK